MECNESDEGYLFDWLKDYGIGVVMYFMYGEEDF